MQYIGLLKGSSICPAIEVSDDPEEAHQQLQNILNRKKARESALASSEGAPSRSPQPKDNKPKRIRTSTVGTREKSSTKEVPAGPVTMVLDKEGTDDEGVPFQRRYNSSSA